MFIIIEFKDQYAPLLGEQPALSLNQSAGLKNIDRGNNFNNIINGIVQEIEFCPSSSDTIYAINQTGDSTEFYRSNDNGLSFNKIFVSKGHTP